MKEHYKKEVEICGEKFEVEYFESSFNLDCKMNLWDKVTSIPYVIKRKTRDLYWDIRYGFQRMFKGYDSVDIIEMYDGFIKRYHKIITRYRKNMMGYPGFMTVEEWNEIIDKMINHLYWMDENNVEKELMKNAPDGYLPCLNTIQNIMDKHKNEFFKLFSEYFYCLWD